MTGMLTESDVGDLFREVSNWGRWGKEDGLGALNFITPDCRRAAAALVSEGRSVSLGRDFPTRPGPGNPIPAQHHMLIAGDDLCCLGGPGMQETMDYIGIAFHGFASTHIDALCHFFIKERMYNGFGKEEVKSTGARRNSVHNLRDGIVGRGVLLDIPGALGIDRIDPDRFIGIEDLELAEEKQGVKVRSGDVLIVRTGRDVGEPAFVQGEDGLPRPRLAGMHISVLQWLKEREVAALCGDGFHDPYAGPVSNPVFPFPIHAIGLVSMGLHLLDNLYLETVLSVCRDLDRWAFQLCVAPLRIEGGTGSPLNPIAIF